MYDNEDSRTLSFFHETLVRFRILWAENLPNKIKSLKHKMFLGT